MKVRIDEGCIGCGLCENLCPEVFCLDDDRISQVIGNADEHTDCVYEAAKDCPVSVIEINE